MLPERRADAFFCAADSAAQHSFGDAEDPQPRTFFSLGSTGFPSQTGLLFSAADDPQSHERGGNTRMQTNVLEQREADFREGKMKETAPSAQISLVCTSLGIAPSPGGMALSRR
jgi:hypothetical protein